VAALAEQFVCVRIQSMNGVNLNQFQFEYDLTWMAFFQNAAGRTYLRYGGREDNDPEAHLSKTSLLDAMRQTLALHEKGDVKPASRYEPVATTERTPEDLPAMQTMMKKRKNSCIHCHDVKVAQLRHERHKGTFRREMIFTYPSPSNLGIRINVDRQNIVKAIDADSPAAMAGLRPGDVIQQVDGERVLTLADFSRVLELAPQTGTLAVTVKRDGRLRDATSIALAEGWRKSADPSWRPSGEVAGPNAGLWGVPADADQRRKLGLAPEELAIKVTFLYRPWSRSAGIRLNDYILSIDGQTQDMTTRQLQSYLHLNTEWGETIELVIRRGNETKTVNMTFPDQPPD